ncbi:unnamed protein product [Musa hybrid cultivar]
MMASSGAEVVAAGDGPVLSLMSKRLRALRKKYNRILQMEESLAQGKPLNKEQEEVLRSKPAIAVLIDEYEKLRQPLAVALQEELARTAASPPPYFPPPAVQEETHVPAAASAVKEEPDLAVRDILTLLYFGCLFDVKPQSEFAATMLTRTHERGCCLTYDYVTDDAIELLGERDLDAISALGSLVTSRPVYSGVSHKNALEACLQHAKHWLSSADQPLLTGTSITYAELREKLNKILASDYFTTTPEMKAPGDVAAAVGKYGVACQVPISESMVAPSPVVQTEGAPTPAPVSCQQKVDEQQNQMEEVHPDHLVIDEPLKMDEPDMVSSLDAAFDQQEQLKQEVDVEDQNQRDSEQKEQQYISRSYRNQRGDICGGDRGSGGLRGYSNGSGGKGDYQNGQGQGQYYDSGFYPKNYYNTNA